MNELVEHISAQLRKQGVDVAKGEIESRLKLLIETFRVPESEARRSVVNYFLKEHGITPAGAFGAGSEQVKVADIESTNKWVDLEIKVIELWEPSSDSISQTGLVGDDTGVIKFVKWTKSGLPDMEEGKSYLLRNVVTDEFQGRFSVKMNRTSEVLELDEEIDCIDAVSERKTEELKICDINKAGCWIDLRAKVVQLWDASSETISQTGLVGDDTGVIKFVKWTKSGLPDMIEGRTYLIKNVVTDEFQDRFSVKLNRSSEIVELDEEIEVGTQTSEFSGVIADIYKGSGLIKRCPICRRALFSGTCGEHGKVDGAYDLRIKAVLDDGKGVQDILANRETTERLTGLSLEDAIEMAMEALDHEVVNGIIEERLVGRYYTVKGSRIDRYLLVETINEKPSIDMKEVDELMYKVEVL
jgi:replication factor A1